MFVYGNPGAVFSLIMTDSSSNTYDIVIDGVIGDTGIYLAQIAFPDITSGTINEVYELELSGDIDPAIALPTTIEFIQNIAQPIINITASSSLGITGFTTEFVQGNAFEVPFNLFINASWTLTSATEDISYLGFTDVMNFKFTQPTAANPEVDATVVNSNTVTLVDATGVQVGDSLILMDKHWLRFHMKLLMFLVIHLLFPQLLRSQTDRLYFHIELMVTS